MRDTATLTQQEVRAFLDSLLRRYALVYAPLYNEVAQWLQQHFEEPAEAETPRPSEAEMNGAHPGRRK